MSLQGFGEGDSTQEYQHTGFDDTVYLRKSLRLCEDLKHSNGIWRQVPPEQTATPGTEQDGTLAERACARILGSQ